MLPPGFLFTVSIADPAGAIVESTQPSSILNIADQDTFLQPRVRDGVFIGQLPRGPAGEAKIQFSRRLATAAGEFEGVVGVRSMLDRVENTVARVTTNPWDGVRRWTSAREVYGFPLAVVVGLSVDEQLAAAHQQMRSAIGWALLGSLVILLVSGVLGRMGWQLARGRLRESEIKLAHAERVEYLAYHDGLTGLPNRSLFSKLLSQNIAHARRHGRRLAVAFLDLDRFKQINDTLGHEAGDELLKEVAVRLKDCVRDSDTVARLGGDEFVVLLPELQDERYAGLVAQKILAAAAKPFTLIDQEFRVTASIGISTYPTDGLDKQTLTKNANIAMYQAKAEGKNNFQFYSEKLNASSLERLTLESGLRHALERNEFQLHFQAKRDIASGRITGVEALLRWEHPDFGTVAPMRFIPVAEETGLIIPIGRWVLKTACLQSVAWHQQGLPRLSIAVNLTPRQFRDEELLNDVTSVLASGSRWMILAPATPRSPACSVSLWIRSKSIAPSCATSRVHRGHGARRRNHCHGQIMSLTVVAQGVETKEQAEHLRLHACDELQGFYFKRPLPADEFTQLLRDQTLEITYVGKRLGLSG